jgi:pimeloyl-ACP methyl ester carboxylesterase
MHGFMREGAFYPLNSTNESVKDLVQRLQKNHDDPGGQIVLLTPGFSHDHSQMFPISSVLNGQFVTIGIDLEPSDAANGLISLANQVRSATAPFEDAGLRIHLLGFSMGGLVNRIAFQLLDGWKSARSLMMIASPNRGTASAWLKRLPGMGGTNQGISDMEPSSELIATLHRDYLDKREFYLAQTTIFNLATWADHLITPTPFAFLPGARNQLSRIAGHNKLIEHPSTAEVCIRVAIEANQSALGSRITGNGITKPAST